MGFGVPLDQWFRGPLRELAHDRLLGKFLERGIVSADFMRYLVDEHGSGRRNDHHQLYVVLIRSNWFESPDEPVGVADPSNSWCCLETTLNKSRARLRCHKEVCGRQKEAGRLG